VATFPALNVWTDAWLADTAHLPRVDRDIYFHLLVLMWRTPNCRVPNDIDWISRKLRCTADEVPILQSVIREFCKSSGNFVSQKRLTLEYSAALHRSKVASDNAKSRQNKEKGASGRLAKTQPSTDSSLSGRTATTTTTINTLSGEVVARARDGDLEALQAVLREAAGWQNEPAPKLHVTGPVAALMAAGADLDLDIIPAVRAIADQASSRTSWNYFLKAIARARDERIAAAKIVTHPNAMRPANGQDRKRGNSLLEAAAQLDDEYAQRIRAAEAREGIEPDAHESARDIG
jgi:uncharacterized protein YdaU (DUF1376 family)